MLQINIQLHRLVSNDCHLHKQHSFFCPFIWCGRNFRPSLTIRWMESCYSASLRTSALTLSCGHLERQQEEL